jgi:type IV secretory pathway protease TraF
LRVQANGTVLLAVSAAAVLVTTVAWTPTPWLLWNTSQSVPVGLYQVHTAGELIVNDLVVAMPPEPLATFLADRAYLPLGAPLIKRVMALAGQTVCRVVYQITIDDIEVVQGTRPPWPSAFRLAGLSGPCRR